MASGDIFNENDDSKWRRKCSNDQSSASKFSRIGETLFPLEKNVSLRFPST